MTDFNEVNKNAKSISETIGKARCLELAKKLADTYREWCQEEGPAVCGEILTKIASHGKTPFEFYLLGMFTEKLRSTEYLDPLMEQAATQGCVIIRSAFNL